MFSTAVKKLLALVAMSAMLSTTTAAQAGGIDSMLQGMYTASANPSYAATANMNVYSAGYVAVRPPLQQFNVIAFTPPNINAGCGGVDAYFGAFSFINSTELEALIKAIGQDAIPFLFKMALGAMCHDCLSSLDQLADQLQKMSSTINNACTLDSGIFAGNSPSLIAHNVSTMFKNVGAAVGNATDSFASFFGSGQPGNTPNANAALDTEVQGTPATQNGASSNTTPASSATFVGNSSWKGIVHNNVEQAFTGETDNATTAQILMSMMGTCIVNLPEGTNTTNNSGPGGNPTSSNALATGTFDGCATHTLTLKDLVDGNQSGQILQCLAYPVGSSTPEFNATDDNAGHLYENACRALAAPSSTFTLGSVGYVGLKNVVSCAIMGTPEDPSMSCSIADPGGAGILSNMENGIPYDKWTAIEQQVMAATPVHFAQYMQATSGSPVMQQTLASMALPYAEDYAAVNLGVAVERAIVNTYEGNIPQPTPEDLPTVFAVLQSQTKTYSDRLAKSIQADNEMKAYVENYLGSLNAHLPGQ
jgi:conjugative transfer pilus assembly protein TraH